MIEISFVAAAFIFSLFCETCGLVLPNSTDLLSSASNSTMIKPDLSAQLDSANIPKARRKRYISQNDMITILEYHNQVRSKVFPPAANMEYMVWDDNLAKSAEAWAATCIWDHGPPYLMRFLGQNLSVRTGRYQSILQLVKPWYDEVKDYAFPYPQDCNPRCPLRCFGPMCTHYTQMVWATTNRVGCAIHTCHNMNVWGAVWRRAVYLVCNYSPKGNWIGEAPYKVGVPCSACPPSYGGSCTDNQCFPGVWDDNLAKSAEAWAATCIWDHGPPYLMRFLGQNLSVRTGRYQSILQLVKPWYDEVKDYAFPYPQDCNPRCPLRCFGPMCTHYTQMVWATTNRVGCAIHTCHNMNVWGAVWRRAVYLVCNYSPKGNWIGEAPYKVGVPCSACPPSYGGSCTDNQCFPGVTSNYLYWFK